MLAMSTYASAHLALAGMPLQPWSPLKFGEGHALLPALPALRAPTQPSPPLATITEQHDPSPFAVVLPAPAIPTGDHSIDQLGTLQVGAIKNNTVHHSVGEVRACRKVPAMWGWEVIRPER